MQSRNYTGVVQRRHRRRTTGMTAMMDMMEQWNEALYGPMMDMWDDMAASWMEMLQEPASMMSMTRPRTRKRKHDYDCCDDCKHCGRDDCHCRCCVHDADLLINARVFERRIVPLVIENSRRRERDVKLELSEFSSSRRDESLFVAGKIVSPIEFTLGPCEERAVILVVESADKDRDEKVKAEFDPSVAREVAVADVEQPGKDEPRELRFGDVDECHVFYADLRVEGCDIRPIRIALALLPRALSSMRDSPFRRW